MSGLDGRLLRVRRKERLRVVKNGWPKVLRGDYTGKITTVNATLLQTLLAAGYTPVIAPLAVSKQGEALNGNADRAAAMVAALRADALVLFTAAPGLLRHFPDEGSLIRHLLTARLGSSPDLRPGAHKRKCSAPRRPWRAGWGGWSSPMAA